MDDIKAPGSEGEPKIMLGEVFAPYDLVRVRAQPDNVPHQINGEHAYVSDEPEATPGYVRIVVIDYLGVEKGTGSVPNTCLEHITGPEVATWAWAFDLNRQLKEKVDRAYQEWRFRQENAIASLCRKHGLSSEVMIDIIDTLESLDCHD